jgi:hypothetical protein
MEGEDWDQGWKNLSESSVTCEDYISDDNSELEGLFLLLLILFFSVEFTCEIKYERKKSTEQDSAPCFSYFLNQSHL